MLAVLFVAGLISLFIWPPLGILLLLLCFFGLLFKIADRKKGEEEFQAAQQAKELEQYSSLSDMRSAAKALKAKARVEGGGSPAAAAYQQVATELEKREALAAERHRRKAEHDRMIASLERKITTKRFWILFGMIALLFLLLFLVSVVADI